MFDLSSPSAASAPGSAALSATAATAATLDVSLLWKFLLCGFSRAERRADFRAVQARDFDTRLACLPMAMGLLRDYAGPILGRVKVKGVKGASAEAEAEAEAEVEVEAAAPLEPELAARRSAALAAIAAGGAVASPDGRLGGAAECTRVGLGEGAVTAA